MIKKSATARAAAAAVACAAVACLLGTAPADAGTMASPPAQPVQDCLLPPAACYPPPQFTAAYGIAPLLAHGTDGAGVTVVLLELATPPPESFPSATDIRQDLARFDGLYHLQAAHIQVDSSLAAASDPWLAGGEELQDTELVHAAAPGAAIREVLISPGALATAASAVAAFTAAVRAGTAEGNVISISASLGEHYWTAAEVASLNAVLVQAQARHVTVVAASGDYGASSDVNFGSGPVKEVSLPASDPLVLAAGGTTLTASPQTGAYIGETAWNTLPKLPGGHSSASGGGFSHLFARPGYQQGVPGTMRGVPDVAADAGFSSGMAVVASSSAQYLIQGATGTSAAAPLWAGVIALADQQAHRGLGFVNPAIYRIASGPYYQAAFHDITTGSNTVDVPPVTITGYQAAPGWDPVTGWGSPDAQVLVPLLARYAG